MSKKGALTIAGAVLGVVLTATVAIGLNLGILARTATSEAAESSQQEASTATPVPAEAGSQLLPEGTRFVTVWVDEPTPVVQPAPPVTNAVPQAPEPEPQQRPKKKAKSAPAPVPTELPPPTATVVPTPEPVPAVSYPIYDVGAAGQVALVFDGNSISFWGAYPNDGWEYAVEDDGPRKVKVKFRLDAEEERDLEFQAELEGGRIKVEVGD